MEGRKKDHINLAFTSQISKEEVDSRFWYEPMAGFQNAEGWQPFTFLGKTMQVPMWVSSMTGGTELAKTINTNLARACREFGMGMGLGSCRILLENPQHLPDFDMRGLIGDELPFFANIGIAQLEHMLADHTVDKLSELVSRLRADGLIIHVNPVQEWIQEEGDAITQPPIETIEAFLQLTNMKVIVKEVGQGMGHESIRRILRLPVAAFELAAFGGTNFAKIELARSTPQQQELFSPLSLIGHSAGEMLQVINELAVNDPERKCNEIIISGGIKSFLDGYYYLSKSKLPAVFGQASAFLKYARGDYQELRSFVTQQIEGLKFAKAYLIAR
jgi:isopentenyl-diphosphate delta-isomerase